LANEDDPHRGAATIERPAPAAAPFATASTSLAVRMETTVLLEGESAAPSTIELVAESDAPFFATLGVSAKRARRRKLFAAALGMLSILVIALGFAASLAGGVVVALCGFLPYLLAMAALPVFAARHLFRRQELRLDSEVFGVRLQSKRGAHWISTETSRVFGFGYQRMPGRPWRWQLVVVFHSGFTVPIDLVVTRRDEVRFVARRLNAALGTVQRSTSG
jgi:hypothetical protein